MVSIFLPRRVLPAGKESTCEARRHQCNTLWNLGVANGILSKDADFEVSSMMIWLDAFCLWASLNTCCVHHQPAHPEEEKQAFSLDHNPQPWSQCKAPGQQCLTCCIMELPPTDVYHLDPLSYAPQWIWGESPWPWALRRLGAWSQKWLFDASLRPSAMCTHPEQSVNIFFA